VSWKRSTEKDELLLAVLTERCNTIAMVRPPGRLGLLVSYKNEYHPPLAANCPVIPASGGLMAVNKCSN
jgi:hypothetical protein